MSTFLLCHPHNNQTTVTPAPNTHTDTPPQQYDVSKGPLLSSASSRIHLQIFPALLQQEFIRFQNRLVLYQPSLAGGFSPNPVFPAHLVLGRGGLAP